ncbi:hypothetical protein Glove_168g136 [Diversispora epigaea]|uniref:Uncharacterized protein n=1 Tax=Diversispora epigaea TaxID=1348612 RepID=A0A397IY53_9GLOM|nr:hypothetical protein Glove_168g136 [Diversispora epigaea]
MILIYSIFAQPNIPSNFPSQTITTSTIPCDSCKIDTSVSQGSIVTSTDSNSPESIFTTITSSTLNTEFLGYTTTFVTTQNIIETSEVYIPPSTVVVIKKVSAVILSVSTSTSTPSNTPKFLKPLLIGPETAIETETDDNNFNGLLASLLPIISSFTSSLATNV